MSDNVCALELSKAPDRLILMHVAGKNRRVAA